MYLYVEKYESNCKWDKDAEEKMSNFYPEELREIGKDIFEHNFMGKETRYQIGYWHKANAIHRWFVENCADGKDDCRTMCVSKEKLTNLLNVCNNVIEDNSKASFYLPTQSGFFFGCTDYDEWYFKDVKYAKDLIEKVLAFLDETDKSENCYYDVKYQASW